MVLGGWLYLSQRFELNCAAVQFTEPIHFLWDFLIDREKLSHDFGFDYFRFANIDFKATDGINMVKDI